MEAQQIITMSINKITGSRGQRGGVNLRKNLLVATVLHSARAMYYEEMCNRMARNTVELNSREMEVEEEDDEDCTGSPDWGDQDECDPVSGYEGLAAQLIIATITKEDKENCPPSTSDVSSAAQARLEKHEPDSTRVVVTAEQKPDSSDNKDRSVLGQKNTNSTPSKTSSSPCGACKRKRSDSVEEIREACESILPKKSKTSDSEDLVSTPTTTTTTTTTKQNSEQITSLVTIFKSGFHGLSGEAKSSSLSSKSNIVSTGASNHLQQPPQSSYAAPPRPFEQLQMAIAAC